MVILSFFYNIFFQIFSFRVLTVSEPVSRKSKTLPGRKVNLNAGAELLEKYQTEWKELHIISEENAKNAEVKIMKIDWKKTTTYIFFRCYSKKLIPYLCA